MRAFISYHRSDLPIADKVRAHLAALTLTKASRRRIVAARDRSEAVPRKTLTG